MAGVVVDVEDESILASIFKEAFPDNWKDNSEFAQYLAELSSFGINRLSREPDRLAEERAQILEQTQDLAFHNYKTFIQTAECGREIFQDFQIIEKHVESMLVKLPELNRSCEEFMKRAQEVNASRKTNNLTLVKHPQLLEFLEIPQLMDTCVRNSYYEEALELTAYVKRLEKKYSNIPVILNIVNEVKRSAQLMLNQLVHQLRTNVQLPACLRVIGYLRRMDVFTEIELRIKFLQARDAWFQSVLLSIPTEEPYHHISKTIELTRVHLFDIITQYRAIFSDDEIVLSSKDERPSESLLFHGWVIQKVSQFLCTLESDLSHGIGGRLDSLLGQCMYFGLSFSRVGADFRGLIAPIFQQAALTSFVKAIDEADNRFDEMLQSYTLLGTQTLGSSIAYGLTVQMGTNIQPPPSLLNFQPLAVYCNNVLTAFNDLRLCAPISLACDVAAKLEESLCKASDCIIAYHRIDETSFSPQELERFGQMCHVFVRELVPFFNRCLQIVFPPSQLAQILGISASDLARDQIGLINQKPIEDSFQHLLPALPAIETKQHPDAATFAKSEVENQTNDKEEQEQLKKDISDTTELTSVAREMLDHGDGSAVIESQSSVSTDSLIAESDAFATSSNSSSATVIENIPQTEDVLPAAIHVED